MGLDWKGSEKGGPFSEAATIDLYPLLQGSGLFAALISFRVVTPTAEPNTAGCDVRLRWRERGSGAEQIATVGLQLLNASSSPQNAIAQFPVDIPAYDPLNTENFLLLDFQFAGSSTDGRWDVEVRLI